MLSTTLLPSPTTNPHHQVVSPFQAILDYEIAQGIPPGYINATIQAHSPNGAWQKVERGEITLDGSFFQQFGDELNNLDHWARYWHKLCAKTDATSQSAVRQIRDKDGLDGDGVPKKPYIDAQTMFWNMMRMSRQPDPWMFPALQKLRASNRYVIAALSNTIDFPKGIRDENGEVFVSGLRENGKVVGDIRSCFETFVSSAHVGLRKPQREIYELAVSEANKIAQGRGLGPVDASDVLFLDDIGGNLKAAKALGMDTIKVNLGRTKDAVRELERKAGIILLDDSRL